MKRFSITALFLVIVLCCFSSTEVCLADVGEWSWEPLWECGYVIMAEDYSHQHRYWISFTHSSPYQLQLFNYDLEQQIWVNIWLPMIPSYHSIMHIFTFPVLPNLLFVSTGYELYRSMNYGETWQQVYQQSSSELIRELIHYPMHSDSTLIMLFNDGVLLRTTDFGDSWIPIVNDLPEGSFGTLKVIDDSCGTLFTARWANTTNDTTLYRSSDGGSHWVASAGGISISSQWINDLFSSSLNTSVFWMASKYGVYRSTDGGWNWTHVGGEVGLVDTFFSVVAEDPVDPLHLYAIQYGHTQFFESTDGGEHWQLTSPYLPGVFYHSYIFLNDSINHSGGVLIGGSPGLYFRNDRNSEFEQVMLSSEIRYGTIRKIARGGQRTVWALNYSMVMRKVLGSDDWFPCINLLGPPHGGEIICGDPQSDSIAYNRTIFKTTDAGASWYLTGEWNTHDPTSKAMAINQENPEHLAVAVIDDRQRVFYSDDQGETYQDITGDLPELSYRDLLIFDGEPETIMLAAFGFSDGGIFATTDYGQSWHHRDGNGLLGTFVSFLGFDPRTGYLYTVVDVLWCSPDTGLTWNDCHSGLPGPAGEIVFDPRPDGDAYIIAQIGIGSDEHGIFRGNPLTGEWELFSAYSTDTLTVVGLMIDPGPPWTIYANLDHAHQGLISWTEPDSATVHPEAQVNKPDKYGLDIITYPNPFNQECRITVRLETTLSAQIKITGEVYNILGQSVKRLDFRQTTPTSFETVWQGKDANDIPLSSGIYLVRIAYGNVKTTGKILLLH